ncbi:MAG TPA: hypothetical protein VGQ52_08995 [Gemmatimonadaceae bacterium]|nr:hypothetical protein [Gemmatimonadaceae bacterium]
MAIHVPIEVPVLSVTRVLRALARFRPVPQVPRSEASPPLIRLTLPLPVVDPPPDQVAPIGDPVSDRAVEIPLYLEP